MFSIIAARCAGLRVRYAEPHRAYHTQTHIDTMLAALPPGGSPLLELATWYHDAIYDPAATDNEARSAALLRGEMAGLADPALIDAAARLVLATASHDVPADLPPPLRNDCAFFLDLDMAVLGAPPALYDAYERGIALEYVPVHGPQAFRHGRSAFLRTTLARPRLFLTEAHAMLEPPARVNLSRAIVALAEVDR